MKRNQNNRRHRNNRLAVEALESRQVMSATLSAGGTWNIVGTNANDEIFVARDDVDPSVLIVEVNGRVIDEQSAAAVKKIQVSGLGGNDRIEIDEAAGAIRIPTLLRGDGGNDLIIGGSGNDTLYGGAGRDRLLGKAGNDQIFGEAGHDSLDGGPGTDALNGGTGRNEIVDEPVASNITNRIPAEWERHDSTWMQWPKGEEVSNRDNFAGIIRALQAYEKVNLVVDSTSARTQATSFLQQRGVPLGNVQFQIMPYDWSWMRDNGAIWVEKTAANGTKSLVVQDWGFDGWGGVGGPSLKDDEVPAKVANIKSVPLETVALTLEKGTLEFNGKDTVITSWPVLHDRNPQMTRGEMESVLKSKFGVSKVVWLEAVPPGDLTNGHVDGIARFINANTVVVSRYADQSDPDSAGFEQSAAIIRAAGFNVVRLDVLGDVTYRGEQLPANYANYLVANGVIIASSFGNAQFDNHAKQQLQQLFPGRTVILTDTRELWFNGGAVHCVTNDQPLLTTTTSAAGSATVASLGRATPSDAAMIASQPISAAGQDARTVDRVANVAATMALNGSPVIRNPSTAKPLSNGSLPSTTAWSSTLAIDNLFAQSTAGLDFGFDQLRL